MSLLARRARQVLIDVCDDRLNFLQSARAGIGFVLIVERFQQIQILAGLRGDVLYGSRVHSADLLARLQGSNDRADIERHLSKHWQIGKSDADPLRAAGGRQQGNGQDNRQTIFGVEDSLGLDIEFIAEVLLLDLVC